MVAIKFLDYKSIGLLVCSLLTRNRPTKERASHRCTEDRVGGTTDEDGEIRNKGAPIATTVGGSRHHGKGGGYNGNERRHQQEAGGVHLTPAGRTNNRIPRGSSGHRRRSTPTKVQPQQASVGGGGGLVSLTTV